jgi:predicted dehydrogenase
MDKPLTLNMEEAKALKPIVETSGLLFALTHNYTGYPMVKEARAIVKSGAIGKVRKVIVEYPQGWLSQFQPSPGPAVPSFYRRRACRQHPRPIWYLEGTCYYAS